MLLQPGDFSVGPRALLQDGDHLAEVVEAAVGWPGFWFHVPLGKVRSERLNPLASLGTGLPRLTRAAVVLLRLCLPFPFPPLGVALRVTAPATCPVFVGAGFAADL